MSMGAGAPVSTKQQTKLAFERTEKNHKRFDRLDQYVIQVNEQFIRKILEDQKVAAYIERTKGVQFLGLGGAWSIFMITGITVARGAKGESGESSKVEARASASLDVINAATGGVAADFTNNNNTSMLVQKSSDFVWAVQLTKIWKSATKKEWDFVIVSKGATFSLDGERPWKDKVLKVLSQELSEVGDFQTLDLLDEEGMIVF